jgi:hypothetical protein
MGATAALVLIGAGTGLMMYGQYQQGRAAKEAGEAEQDIAEYNAKVAEQEGVAAQQAALYEARKLDKEGRRLVARQRAGYAKAGVLMSGTPLTVLEDTVAELEMDKFMILREGMLGKQRGESAATVSRLRGQAAKERGKNLYRGSILSTIGTGLTGLGTMGLVPTNPGQPFGGEIMGSGHVL